MSSKRRAGEPQQDPVQTAAELEALNEDARQTAEALVELGIDQAEAEAAVRDGRVPLVLASKVLDEPTPYTLDDIAEGSGLPHDMLEELYRATSLTGPTYGQDALEAAHMFAQLLEIFPYEALLRSARARTMSLGAVVRSDISLVRDQILLPLREAGADDLTVAIALAEHAGEFDRVSRRLLAVEYRAHMRHVLRNELSVLAANTESPEVVACVGFVDLVGYTALSARVDPSGLDDLLDAFEQRVVEAASHSDDVTVVKFLGDAAMFVASDLHELIDVLLRLVTQGEGYDEIPVRAGLARGGVLLREGDYFGTPVNVAARLTGIARPWSLLADDDLRDDVRDHYDTRRIRPVAVRGLGHRRPVVIKPSFDVARPARQGDEELPDDAASSGVEVDL